MVRLLTTSALIGAALAGRMVHREVEGESADLGVNDHAKEKKSYTPHVGKACWVEGGGASVLEKHDPEMMGWPTLEKCQGACDQKSWCQGFTRGVGASSMCWLRSKVTLHKCKDDSKFETYVRQGKLENTPTCMNHTELNCEKSVTWAWNIGRKQSWAKKAFSPIFMNASGVKFEDATVEDYHHIHYCGGPRSTQCELPPCTCSKPPCDRCGANLVKEAKKAKGPSVHINLKSTGGKPFGYKLSSTWAEGRGRGTWCEALKPVAGWNLNGGCSAASVEVKVLTYNLFWWNLFGQRKGANRMAGRLVEKSGPYDIMGFQECDDAHWIVNDTMPADKRCSKVHGPHACDECTHGIYNGTNAVSNAWLKSQWRELSRGDKQVSEDGKSQWYGTRGLVYNRLEHRQTKKKVAFYNFHGALPVGGEGGGMCGGLATAYNILRVIGETAHKGDSIILVGDFNSVRNSLLLNTLAKYLKLQYQGKSFGGVDNIYTNDCAHLLSKQNLGAGGSDHDALGVKFKI